jgi:formate hydrogenlyase subunit 3/multisubunit Na+/H+ antiporter MnhD subunit
MTATTALVTLLPLLPFAGAAATMALGPDREARLARTAIATTTVHIVATLALVAAWWLGGRAPVDVLLLTLYAKEDTTLALRAAVDGLSLAFLGVGAWLTWLVTLYSRIYLHRESGYRRVTRRRADRRDHPRPTPPRPRGHAARRPPSANCGRTGARTPSPASSSSCSPSR